MLKTFAGIMYELQDRENGEKVATVITAVPRKNAKKSVRIPSKIDGYTVTSVANYAFLSQKNNWIESVAFDSEIRWFGYQAFCGLENLRKVNFNAEQNTPTFSGHCFENCENLREINFSNHEKFGEVCLYRSSYAYPEKEKSLILSVLRNSSRGAFRGCWKMPIALEEH